VLFHFADDQTLAHLLWFFLQVVDPQDDEHWQVEGEQTCADQEGYRHGVVLLALCRALVRLDVVFEDSGYHMLEVEGEADGVGQDEHKVLVEGLPSESRTLLDYYSSSCSFSCWVVLREMSPKMRERVITMQSTSKLIIILSNGGATFYRRSISRL